jgi:hypothetical protein
MKAGKRSQDMTKHPKRRGDRRVLEGSARQIAARKKVDETNVREEWRDEW